MQEISEQELRALIRTRLEERGADHPFTLYRFPRPDSSGRNWHVTPETVNGNTLSEIPRREFRRALREIFEELRNDYNIEP